MKMEKVQDFIIVMGPAFMVGFALGFILRGIIP